MSFISGGSIMMSALVWNELSHRPPEEMRIGLSKPRVSDPSKEGVVTATGYLNGKQTVTVTFDDGTVSASKSYADEFRKLD